MGTNTENMKLICDVHSNMVRVTLIPALEKTIEFAATSLNLALKPVELGEMDGSILFGLMLSSDNVRTPTDADQAAIGAFVKCCEENKELHVHHRMERTINDLSIRVQRIEDGINAILAHLGHPEAEGRESASPRLGRGLDALIPPASKSSGKGKPKAGA